MDGKTMYVGLEIEAAAIPPFEEDRPSAGTWCRVCKEIGHFCQAVTYYPEDDTIALCDPCSRDEWCPTVALVRGTSSKADPFFIPKTSRAERIDNRQKMITDALMEGKSVKEIAFEFNFSKQTVLQIRDTLSDLPKTRMGRRPGTHYKTELRNQAAALLKSGESLRTVSEATGLAKNTVMSVRKEVEADLPTTCECGNPLGHKGWCKKRWKRVSTQSAATRELVNSRSLSPVTRGERATYTLNAETKKEIAADAETDVSKLAAKYRCSRQTVYNIRKAAGTYVPTSRRGPEPKKAEVAVTIPVSVVTVPCDEPTRDVKPSIYEQVVWQAEEEMKAIESEIQRLHKRRNALKAAIDALKNYIDSENTERPQEPVVQNLE